MELSLGMPEAVYIPMEPDYEARMEGSILMEGDFIMMTLIWTPESGPTHLNPNSDPQLVIYRNQRQFGLGFLPP